MERGDEDMSNVIDDRVVNMKFDNENFESNVRDTIKSLDDLDKSLKNMDKGSYGDSLSSALGGIGSAVDDLSSRFDAWGIVGMEVVRRVADYAIEKGAEIVTGLSTDNLMEGWRKYESVNESVYAIINQITDGTTYEEVVRAVEKLAWYSDETSFSLSDMVVALKGFMQQGMSLKEAVPIIMGIGNSAMYAGANAKDASGAFLIWSKASASNLSLRQWQQLSTTFGVTTYQFKQMALDAGVAAGTLEDLGNGLYKTSDGLEVSLENFETTLGAQSGKWFTKEVQTELFGANSAYGGYIDGLAEYIKRVKESTGVTLLWEDAVEEYNNNVLGGTLTDLELFGLKAAESATVAKTLSEAIDAIKDAASTSWMEVFKNLFGLVEEAKVYWTDLSSYLNGIFVGPIQTIANYTKAWGELTYELGGRSSFIQSFRNMAEVAESVVAPIKDAYAAVFGIKEFGDIVSEMGKLVKRFELFIKSLVLTEEESIKFQRVWETVFEILKFVGTAVEKIWGLFKAAGSVVSPIIGLLGDLSMAILDVIGVTVKVFNMEGNLWTWLQGPTNALKKMGQAVADSVAIFKISSGPVIDGVTDSFDAISDAAGRVGEGFSSAGTSVMDLYEKLKKSDSFIAFKNNLNILYEDLKNSNSVFLEAFKMAYSESGGGVVGTVKGAYSGVKAVISEIYDSLAGMLDEHLGGALTKIKEFAASIEQHIKDAGATIKGFASSLLGGGETSILGASLFGDVKKTQEDADSQLTGIERLRKNAEAEMAAVAKAGDSMTAVFGAGSLVTLSTALIRIDNILKGIGSVLNNSGKMFKNIGGTFSQLTKSLKNMQLEVKADILRSIATSILILTGSLLVLSQIPTENIVPKFASLSVLVGEMAGLMALVKKLDFEGTTIGFDAASRSFTSTSGGMKQAATSFLMLSASLLVLSAALAEISKIDPTRLGMSTAALTVLLLDLTLFAKTTDGMAGGFSGNVGTNIFKMASGLVLMAQAIKMLGDLADEDNTLSKGILSITTVLLSLFAFSASMKQWGGGDMVDMSNLIGLAAGLAALALVIKMYGLIPADQLQQGSVAVISCLAFLALIMAALTEQKVDAKNMLGIAAAFDLLAVGMIALAGALLIFNAVSWESMGQAALAIVALIGAAKLIDMLNLDKTLLSFGVSLAALGVGIAGIGVGTLAFATAMTVIAAEAPAFAAGLITTIQTILIGIVALKPKIVAAILTLIEAACEVLIVSWDLILNTLEALILQTLRRVFGWIKPIASIIKQHWPEIKAKIVEVWVALKAWLDETGQKIKEWLVNTLKSLGTTIKENWPIWLQKLWEGFTSLLSNLLEIGGKILVWLGELLLNILSTIVGKIGDIISGGKDLIRSFLEGITDNKIVTDILMFPIELLGWFVEKLLEGAQIILNAGKSLIGWLKDGLTDKDKKKDIYDAGTGIVDEYNRGINDKGQDAKREGERIAGLVEEGVSSVDLYNSGVEAINGLAKGLDDKRANTALRTRAKELGTTVEKSLKNRMEIKSPSKVTERIGAYATEGLAKGLLSKTEYDSVLTNAFNLGGNTTDSITSGLESKLPNLYSSIDDAEEYIKQDTGLASKEIAENISTTFDENLDREQEISIVVDTKEFDEKIAYIDGELSRLRSEREEEIALREAMDESKVSNLDNKIKTLENAKANERMIINADEDGGIDVGGKKYYDFSEAISAQAAVLAEHGIGMGAYRNLVDSDANKPEQTITNISVNQTINSPDPVSPVEQYRAGQMALHGLNINGINYSARDLNYASSTT